VPVLDEVAHPIVLAPLAGGPSTAALTAAVIDAGAFGFLAAGYLSAAELQSRMLEVRRRTAGAFGVNLFVPGQPSDGAAVAAYAPLLEPEAIRHGVPLGEPRFDDDGWEEKVALLLDEPVAAVSFTFGCPAAELVEQFQRQGTEVWVTVTTPAEAAAAAGAGADVLVAQGTEAGGHRGT
jgi:nitronate monooxygenase